MNIIKVIKEDIMRVIRKGVFETNSSSTHSITLCSKEEYDKWNNGELFLDKSWRAEKKFITKEEAIEKLKNNKYNSYDNLDFDNEEKIVEAMRKEELYTPEDYFDEYLESFESTYITKSGEEVIAFGQYGYDG
jgi:hypothetical protein